MRPRLGSTGVNLPTRVADEDSKFGFVPPFVDKDLRPSGLCRRVGCDCAECISWQANPPTMHGCVAVILPSPISIIQGIDSGWGGEVHKVLSVMW